MRSQLAASRAFARFEQEFAHELGHCRTEAALCGLVEAATKDLGLDYFALVHRIHYRGHQSELISNNNYPEAWAEEFEGHRLYLDDPVLKAVQRIAMPFRWSEVGRITPLGRANLQVMERAGRYGMGEGFTIPANVPGEPTSSLSFAVRPGRILPRLRLACAERIGMKALHAARRINGLPANDLRTNLTRRRRECISLIAAGLSDPDIARMLGVTPETVKRHVRLAREAYGASTRAQLVALALRDGHILFNDALPARSDDDSGLKV